MTYYREKYATPPDAFPNATALSEGSISLPVGPHVDQDDVRYIADRIRFHINDVNS
jgi:dTDP-4-amino-4,6-dideoxygalactose transaminase